MHGQKTQQQFIELRVQGRSYARIAEELHHSINAARCRNGAETVQFSPRQSLEIEETLALCELWMTEARQSFARYQQFQPHRRVSLGLAARLIGLALCREVEH